MIRFLAVAACLIASAPVYAGECAAIVGWVGVPLCNVEVPDVVGQDLTTADATLATAALDSGDVTTQCSAQPADEVLQQDPTAGAQATPGSDVDLVASDGTACSIEGAAPTQSISIGIGIRL